MKSTAAAGSGGKSVDVDAVDENDDDDDDDANDDDDDDNDDDNDDDVGGGVDVANTFPNSAALNAFGHRVLATIGVHVRATKVSYGGDRKSVV